MLISRKKTRLAKSEGLLGTDIKQLGFKVEYERFEEDLWLPVSYGGEFKVVGVVFYKRTMALARHKTLGVGQICTSLSEMSLVEAACL
jgi:hypothetical protein